MKDLTKKRLLIGLILLNLLFIFGNSLLPAEVSAAISGKIKAFLALLFPLGGGYADDAGHGLLRKLAHFAEFACLGFLLLRCLRLHRISKPFLPALLCAFLAACIDETLQLFSPGRAAAVLDVLLDTFGALCGIVIAHIPLFHRKQS